MPELFCAAGVELAQHELVQHRGLEQRLFVAKSFPDEDEGHDGLAARVEPEGVEGVQRLLGGLMERPGGGGAAAAAEKYDPARITRYCIDVASAYHRFYNACRILDAEGAVQQGRIALCLAVRGVIHNILTMFKVNAPETM